MSLSVLYTFLCTVFTAYGQYLTDYAQLLFRDNIILGWFTAFLAPITVILYTFCPFWAVYLFYHWFAFVELCYLYSIYNRFLYIIVRFISYLGLFPLLYYSNSWPILLFTLGHYHGIFLALIRFHYLSNLDRRVSTLLDDYYRFRIDDRTFTIHDLTLAKHLHRCGKHTTLQNSRYTLNRDAAIEQLAAIRNFDLEHFFKRPLIEQHIIYQMTFECGNPMF